MSNLLAEIVAHKQLELSKLKDSFAYNLSEMNKRKTKNFKAALSAPGLSVIGEVKRQSPSKGKLAEIASPLELVDKYVTGGVSALSVLTDEHYFAGSLEDLIAATNHLQHKSQPVLRKDFIIDELQIIEAVLAGADAVLLIVAVLGQRLEQLIQQVRQYNIDALVEVHNQQELKAAIDAGATIIGVNNRDLTTFTVDLKTSENLIKKIPNRITTVSESGISTPEQARALHQVGFDAVLVGEGLVTCSDPANFIQKMRSTLCIR